VVIGCRGKALRIRLHVSVTLRTYLQAAGPVEQKDPPPHAPGPAPIPDHLLAGITCERACGQRAVARGVGGNLAIVSLSVYNVHMDEVREPTFLMLAALAEGPRHGYGLIQDVERLSNGKTKLRPGTLYATLDRLTSKGLIETSGEEVVEGRLRRYYRLTSAGTAVLESESKQRLMVATEALRRLRVSGATPGRLAGGLS